MDRSSTYENKVSNDERCEIFMNNVIMEKKMKIIPMCKLKQTKIQKLMKNHENKIFKIARSTKIVKPL
jgi:hypothetical protein